MSYMTVQGINRLGYLWAQGKLINKVGAVFCTTATNHDGVGIPCPIDRKEPISQEGNRLCFSIHTFRTAFMVR